MSERETLKDLVRELAEERGLDLQGYKPTTLERRVRRRMQQLNIGSYHQYLDYVRTQPAETTELLNTVLINVTRFFRDPPAWDMLAKEVLPMLFQNRMMGSTFRAWSAGCATGEEAFSIAILLCEFLGERLKDYEIKIYATDNDENALNVARRSEYPLEALRGVRSEIKEKYFTGDRILRLNRELRRLVIFGRSNLLSDAPISHVDLLVCRNVLIYFDTAAQAHILSRLKYALNEGGVLFLGKSESQLKANSDFMVLNPKWRIFQRRSAPGATAWANFAGIAPMEAEGKEKTQQELQTLKLYYDSILTTLEPGVLMLDSGDTVITENEKALKLWDLSNKMTGQKLQNTEFWQRCPELKQHLEESRVREPKTVTFECYSSPSTVVNITVRPIVSQGVSGPVGTLIYMENITPRVTLQSTIEELETTAEELQSTNEELETTNEELQSTNEELETTNEELQSTNEELETTNEELQSLNEELETTNEELSSRTRELDEVNARYSEMMERMPWPVFLVNEEALIYMFNSAAQKLFGFAKPSEKGMKLEELPLDQHSRQAMVRRYRNVVQARKASTIPNCHLVTNRYDGPAEIYFSPLSKDNAEHGVIVMVQVGQAQQRASAAAKTSRKGNSGPPQRRAENKRSRKR